MDKRQVIFLTAILLTALLSGCRGQSKKQQQQTDEFYTTSGGWDWIRVPLLKPYEVKKVDPEIEINTWTIQFFYSLGPFSVKRVSVKDSIIYLLCGKMDNDNGQDSTLVNLRSVPTGWFVVDTRKKTEKGFPSQAAFDSCIRENKYPIPEWHDIDSLSKVLSNGGKVPWVPQ